jgi:lactoylglutathione lyase
MAQHTFDEIGVHQLIPLLDVRDMETSLRFYVDGLGFSIKHTWTPENRIRWCWLELGTAPLMLQEIHSDATHPRRTEGQLGLGVGLNFQCRDSLAFYHVMKARGIQTKRPFVGNRAWVTSLVDPDGYRLYFQSPADVPEKSEYQE